MPVTGACVAPPVPGNQLSTQAMAYAEQLIYVGSTDTTNLGKYFSTIPLMQVRYLDHGRDEVGSWLCPQQ